MSEKTRSAFYDQPHPYISLFIKMLTISAFTFGGGFVIISMMRRTFAQKLKWLDDQEVMDMTAITLCEENKLPVKIINIFEKGNIFKALTSDEVGSLVTY